MTPAQAALQIVNDPPTTGSEMSVLLQALTALKKGQPNVRLPAEWTGVAGKVADAFNEVVEINEQLAAELARLRRSVGKEGKLSQRLSLGNVGGFWQGSVRVAKAGIGNLLTPT